LRKISGSWSSDIENLEGVAGVLIGRKKEGFRI
jgi:hypothetical protein